ncbi:MAG: hypothetical protein KAI64_01135, partial [Thermoplasmata archaeon]|nr:hypothetical protein [Thermoplasmata archaeon]
MSLLLISAAFTALNIARNAEADSYYWEDFDPVNPTGWNSTGLWHWVDDGGDPCIGNPGHPPSSHSSVGSYGYHDDVGCDYITPGSPNEGNLTSPAL